MIGRTGVSNIISLIRTMIAVDFISVRGCSVERGLVFKELKLNNQKLN